jgi:hypothetical protein
MRNVLKTLGLAAALTVSAGVASAQDFGVQIGIGDNSPRRVERRIIREERPIERRIIREERPVVRRGVVEERVIRRPARTRTVCTTRTRETVTPSGRVIRRPVEVCRQVGEARY